MYLEQHNVLIDGTRVIISKLRFRGSNLPGKAVHSAVATMKAVRPCWGTGRVVVADSLFGSLITAALLYAKGLYAVLAIKKRRYWPRGFRNELLDRSLGAKVGDYSAVSTNFPNPFSTHGFK